MKQSSWELLLWLPRLQLFFPPSMRFLRKFQFLGGHYFKNLTERGKGTSVSLHQMFSPARMVAEVFTFTEESFWVSIGSQNRSKCCFVRKDSSRSHSGDQAAQEVLTSVQGAVSLPCVIALTWEASVLGVSALPGG